MMISGIIEKNVNEAFGGMLRLIEDRQVEAGKVDQLDLEPAMGPGELVDPAGDQRPLRFGRVLQMMMGSFGILS